MRDIKQVLKEAREAIKNKNFEMSLKLSKEILKEDKTNYMGLVFLGLSLQEVGPLDQAPKAFKKAIQENPSNPLAWTGLINYYEKINIEDKEELGKTYSAILQLEPNEKKLIEYAEKLSALTNTENLEENFQRIYKSSQKPDLSPKAILELEMILFKIVSPLKTIPENLISEYHIVLQNLIKDNKTVSKEIYNSLLTVLHKQGKPNQVIEQSLTMLQTFEDNPIALSWICRIFNQCFVEDNLELILTYEDRIRSSCSTLLRIEKDNAMALFTHSLFLVKQSKVSEGIDCLQTVVNARPGLIHAWFMLTELYLNLKLTVGAKRSISKCEKLLFSNNYSNPILERKLGLFLVEIGSVSDDPKDWEKGWETYLNCKETELKNNLLPFAIEIKINMNKLNEAEVLISELDRIDSAKANLLKAKVLVKNGDLKSGLEVMKQKPFEAVDYYLTLGSRSFDLENYSESLTAFLKAAKCDPNNYLCFLKLGTYYNKVNDLEKARRCFEKAFKLNMKSIEACTSLSQVYRSTKNWEANIKLLQSVTSEGINKSNTWAFLQLGLSYLEQEDYMKAIDSFRLVIRLDPTNLHCWESLGDAYYARGAFTSALKCYEASSQLSESSLYPKLQLANIKLILAEYVEASKEFESILEKNDKYVPALKGLSEACLCLAKQRFREQRLGTARDYAQKAVDKLTIGVKQNNELACLWKLLGDGCLFAAKLPEKYSCLFLSKSFAEGKETEGKSLVEKEELFKFAARCYCVAIILSKEDVLVWHDLAACYYFYGKSLGRKDLIENAMAAARYCVVSNPGHWQHWNLLGNIALASSPPNFALAQHCFIKAVTVEHNAATAWNNLGVLYFYLGDIRLANKALQQGQRADPNYVNSWIGQALIAESMGHEDAMDLFRHSTQLAVQPQGGLGYGHWVCRTLVDSEPGKKIYAIHNMHAIPVACDALVFYTERNPYDGSAWNILGILKERLGLLQGAEIAFRNAFRLTDRAHRDQARVNYARILTRVGKYKEAIAIYEDILDLSFKSGSGLALALFKDKQYEKSYEAYDQALHYLAEKESHQSDILVALATMAYMFQGAEEAKTLLFQSINLNPPSPWSFYATLSLGLLHDDKKLSKLVIKEMDCKLRHKKECLEHYSTLLSHHYLIQGDSKRAKTELAKLIHLYPDQASLWLNLSILQIRLYEEDSCLAAASCASAALILGKDTMDVRKLLCLVSLACILEGKEKQAIITAQKAVHAFPEVAECWAVLASALRGNKNKTFLKQVHQHVYDLTPKEDLRNWCRSC